MTPEKTTRLVNSYAPDLIHGITNGRFITVKHFALSMALHGLTGSQEIIDILNELGNAMSYEPTCDIETAPAEKARKLSSESTVLSLMPQDNGGVSTVFWVDNFDCIIESVTGGGSVNTTHMIVFQEKANINQYDTNIVRTKARKFTANHVKESTSGIKIDPRASPPNVSTTGKDFQDSSRAATKYFIWLLLQKMYGTNAYTIENNQIIPNFSGMYIAL